MRLDPSSYPPRPPPTLPTFDPHVTLGSHPSDAAALIAAVPIGHGAIPIWFKELQVGGKLVHIVVRSLRGSSLETLRGHLVTS
ncbi:hypothetical protein BV20DRAFT_960807 [Pilatotrama ljubarskyi]|nr:hypothetical protein BV20DRAFT_960807 [Pilatotrama ljubarskyi]